VIRVITMVNLSNVDLNLFLVLHTVLEEGSATKAATRLHVTQSAVSNALARLRAVLGDPLVVRSGNRLVATPRAAQLAPRIAAAVEQLRYVVETDHGFDPGATRRRFTMACADYHEVVLLPVLSARFAARMPRASLRVVTPDHLRSHNGLETGGVEALLDAPTSVPPGCVAEELFVDDGVCVVRRDHPFRGATMSPAELAAWPHVALAPAGESPRWIDDALARRGLEPPPVLVVSHFTIAALVAARTDHVAALPRRMVHALADTLPLRVVDVPELGHPAIPASLVWHARTDADPAARFFREMIREAARALPESSPAGLSVGPRPGRARRARS
jgi:DNA-binding transcriptional LysR family regulator